MDDLDWDGVFEEADPNFGRPPTPPHPIFQLETEMAMLPRPIKPNVEEYMPQKLKFIRKLKKTKQQGQRNILLEEAEKRRMYLNENMIVHEKQEVEEEQEVDVREENVQITNTTIAADSFISSASPARTHPARVTTGKSRTGINDLNSSRTKRTRARSTSKRKTKIKALRVSTAKKKLQKEIKRVKASTSKKALIGNDQRLLQAHHAAAIIAQRNVQAERRPAVEREMSEERTYTFLTDRVNRGRLFEYVYIPPKIAQTYQESSQRMERMTVRMIELFKRTVYFIQKEGGRFWFLLEEPFSEVNIDALKSGHAFVTKIPHDFRISLLPDVLRGCKFNNCRVTHVVVNLTFNLVTKFDTHEMGSLDKFFTEILNDTFDLLVEHLPCFKALGILGVPIEQLHYHKMHENINIKIQQDIINIRKRTDTTKTVRFIPFEGRNKEEISDSLERLPRRLDHFFKGDYKQCGCI